MTGLSLSSLIDKYPAEYLSRSLHKQESPFDRFPQNDKLLPAMLRLSASCDPYKDIACADSEMDWRTEIRHPRHYLEEIDKFLLHV